MASGQDESAGKRDSNSSRPTPVQVKAGNQTGAAASPRSSVSADNQHSPRTPISPFLHNLHHRLRKGSIASSSASSSEVTASNEHADPVDKDEAARAAKRFLLATVRNDWEWPPASTHDIKDLTDETQKKTELLTEREPVGWRSREEGPSDFDSDSSLAGRRRKRNSDPYRFENPNAIGASIFEKKLKKRKKIEDELEWNEGLRVWQDRRDAWTGAVASIPQKSPLESDGSVNDANMTEPQSKLSPDAVRPQSQNSQDSQNSHNLDGSPVDQKHEVGKSKWPLVRNSSSSTKSPSTSSVPKSASTGASSIEPDLNAPYLPVYPPLFPTSHTLRARIKPPAYPTIYSKVVVQSLTPNVPIPLTHMIGALVDGWKSEGNWPPQAAAAEAAQAMRQKRNSKQESAFSRWRRDQEEKRRLKSLSGEGDPNTHGHGIMNGIIPIEEGEVEKKGLRKSLTGVVKRVFGIDGEIQDSDGGLERMGVKFTDQNELDEESEDLQGVQGLMQEAKEVMNDNVALNKNLVDGTPS